jgi:glycosyltransferase involved in cell wall biosynthesis
MHKATGITQPELGAWDESPSARLDRDAEGGRIDNPRTVADRLCRGSGPGFAPVSGSGESRIAVVIPSYKVSSHILGVLERIGPEVARIYVVDDECPDGSGRHVRDHCADPRVVVLWNETNLGVGGAVMTGYQAAIEDGNDIIVKIDGDGQMDPALIPDFVAPILAGQADYTKGNRFYDLEEIRAMPRVRLFGNAALSFITKLSSGYWDLFDPTNGYTAIHRDAARHLPFKKISQRYFFEIDMLFRLNTLRAVVVDIPMDARYGDEVSNLKISGVIGEFAIKSLRNFVKRVFYNYYLRDMSLASIELPLGLLMFVFGCVFGTVSWIHSASMGLASSPGTVMLSALPIIVGLQLLLAFLSHDISAVPTRPFHRLRRNFKAGRIGQEA